MTKARNAHSRPPKASPEQAMKDRVLMAMLDEVPYGGWNTDSMRRAAQECGMDDAMLAACFVGGLTSLAGYFSDWADRAMLQALSESSLRPMRVRDRIAQAVWTRIEILEPHKIAVQGAASSWIDVRGGAVGKDSSDSAASALWRSADCIWNWAGDESTDYNYYTKRGLLCAVMASTLVFWLADTSQGHLRTRVFLERRIDGVLAFGQRFGPLMRRVASGFEKVNRNFGQQADKQTTPQPKSRANPQEAATSKTSKSKTSRSRISGSRTSGSKIKGRKAFDNDRAGGHDLDE